MAGIPAKFRRKVLSGYKTTPHWSNYYRVDLSCGHKNQVAQGFKGTMPKTSACYQCYKEAMDKEADSLYKQTHIDTRG